MQATQSSHQRPASAVGSRHTEMDEERSLSHNVSVANVSVRGGEEEPVVASRPTEEE